MATHPDRTPRSREPSPLPTGPCASGDRKREAGEAGEEGGAEWVTLLARVLAPPHVLASQLGTLARPRRALPAGILGPPSQSSRLARRGREIRVSPKMVARGSG
jgi:hypothetical protein